MNKKNMNQTENLKEERNLLSLNEMVQIIGGEDATPPEDIRKLDDELDDSIHK